MYSQYSCCNGGDQCKYRTPNTNNPMQTLEFEREREAYIDAAKQLLAPPPPPRPATEAPAAATGENAGVGGERTRGGTAGGGGETWRDDGSDGGHQHHQSQQRKHQQRRQERSGLRRSRPGGGVAQSRAAPLREAREERRLASEEIRTLQHRKADARVRLQAERLGRVCTSMFVCLYARTHA